MRGARRVVRRRWVALAAAAAFVIAVLAAHSVADRPAVAGPAATFTLLTGNASVKPAGNQATRRLAAGDQLHQGDEVTTGPESKAVIAYPDGSATRLDSNTVLTVVTLADTQGGERVVLAQRFGRTWNHLPASWTGAGFRLNASNASMDATAGTDFETILEEGGGARPAGAVVATFRGSVGLRAPGYSGSVAAGRSSFLAPNGTPSPPAPVPAEVEHDAFTVFNTTLGVTTGSAATIAAETLSGGQVTPRQPAVTAPGGADLDFALGWPGSRFELDIFSPDGRLYERLSSDHPPIHVIVPAAAPGPWSYAVHDLTSEPMQIYWVIVSRAPLRPAAPIFTMPSPCAHTVTAGDTDRWTVATTAARPAAVVVSDAPAYATLVDHGDGSAAITVAPPASTGAADIELFFTATAGDQPPVNFVCVEHVLPRAAGADGGPAGSQTTVTGKGRPGI